MTTQIVEFTAGPVTPEKISALSLEYVQVPIAAYSAGAIYNPTADTVQIAIITTGARPASGDWKSAQWETRGSGTTVEYLASIDVGPGGAVTPAVGRYDVFVKITDNPSVPVKQATSPLTVY